MNKERLKRVRDAIAEAPAEHFDMNVYLCGTSACIAGFCVLDARAEGRVVSKNDHFHEFAGDTELTPHDVGQMYLEITREEADHLFLGWWAADREEFLYDEEDREEYPDHPGENVDLNRVTREAALEHIDSLLAE